MQDPCVVGKNFGSFPSNFFTQPFQYFQIVNLVDCLSSWYKFTLNNSSNITASALWRVRELYWLTMYNFAAMQGTKSAQYNRHTPSLQFYDTTLFCVPCDMSHFTASPCGEAPYCRSAVRATVWPSMHNSRERPALESTRRSRCAGTDCHRQNWLFVPSASVKLSITGQDGSECLRQCQWYPFVISTVLLATHASTVLYTQWWLLVPDTGDDDIQVCAA